MCASGCAPGVETGSRGERVYGRDASLQSSVGKATKRGHHHVIHGMTKALLLAFFVGFVKAGESIFQICKSFL